MTVIHEEVERQINISRLLNWVVAALAALVMLFGGFWVQSMSSRLDTLQRAVEEVAHAQADINRDREKRLALLEATLTPMKAQLDRIESKVDAHLAESRTGR